VSPPTTGGASLLSASLSANAFHAPPPKDMSDELQDSISELSRKFDKRSDARAVAMSHVFSTLDDAMGKPAVETGPAAGAASNVASGLNTEDEGAVGAKDSWIDGERKSLDTALLQPGGAEGEGEGGQTPKPPIRKMSEEGKGKRAVTFQEPKKEPRDQDEDPAGDSLQRSDPDHDGMYCQARNN
jgi:hypothetical protein